MKKLLMALAIAGFTCCGAEAQTLQSTINSLTNFSSYAPPVVVKKIAKAPKKRKKLPKKPDYSANFKICSGTAGYYICDERPGMENATHSKMTITIQAPNTTRELLYELPADPTVAAAERDAPEEQSYPGVCGALNLSSYRILYPDKNLIKAGRPHKATGEPHYAYQDIPKEQYDGREKNKERNENVNNPNASVMTPGEGRSE